MPQNTKKSSTKSSSSSSSGSRGGSKSKTPPPPEKNTAAHRGIGAVVCLFLSIFSFIGYFKIDAWFITYFCGFVKGLLGWGYWLFPPMLMLCAIELAFSRQKKIALKIVSALMTPVFLGGLLHLFLGASADMTFEAGIIRRLYETGVDMQSGGVVSGILAMGFKSAVSVYGAAPVFLLGFLFFALNAFGLTIRNLIDIIREHHDKAVAYRAQYVPEEPEPSAAPDATSSPAPETLPPPVKGRRGRRAIDIPLEDVNAPAADYAEERVGFFNTRPRVKTPDQFLESGFSPAQASPVPDSQPPFDVLPPLQPPTALETAELTSDSPAGAPSRKIKRVEVQAETEEISKKIEKEQEFSPGEYRFPPLNLLESAASAAMDGSEEVSLNRERLENTIRSFGVSGAIKGVTRGPTVTRYDLELDQGVKLAKLMGLAGDLALSLGVLSVRIAPIPDKISTVGIEVPNKFVSTVLLRDIIASPSFRNAQSKLSFAVGKDIGGSAIIGNISKLPHLLIAGTTGSGKSVCMNSLILSLLYKSTPEEVRLIMIDPKMVELGVYNGIPHLFVPVVTDPKKAAGALQWAVVEMLKRYRYFSEVGVRDLTGYNIYQKNRGEPTMPRVVIVIDELADLMLVASKEVEETICRVAQMGRAAGMHLVIATQRPSADVITGLMKANIPSRIAFAVSSAMESRIILDNSGADKLVGAGDMLYSPLGGGKPMRVQGAFVTDEEREKVIAFVKESSEADYSEDILAQIEKAAEDKPTPSEEETNNTGFGADYDELLPQAVEVILETKQASVSMLQRRLKLGYARAARVVDQMEELGIVGPFEGSKPRQLLMTKQQWQELQLARGVAPVRPDTDEVSFSEYSDAPEEEWKD